VHIRLEQLQNQLRQAQELEYIIHLEFQRNYVVVHFAQHVLYKTIHELVRHINLSYKDVAWVPSSLYLVNPTKRITIHYKRDHS
jgi:hypothetical protein